MAWPRWLPGCLLLQSPRPIRRHAVIYALAAGFTHHAKSSKGLNPALARGSFLYSIFQSRSSGRAKLHRCPSDFYVSWSFRSHSLQWIATSLLYFRKRLFGESHLRDLPRVGLPTTDYDVDVKGV